MGSFCKRLLIAVLGAVIADIIIDKIEKIADRYIDEYEKRPAPDDEQFNVDRHGNIWLRDEDCKIE